MARLTGGPIGADHEIERWIKDECFAFYVEQRRKHCTHLQLMDLWLVAPWCGGCIASDPIAVHRFPDICHKTWKNDLDWSVGGTARRRTLKALRLDPDYAWMCRQCACKLRPWDGSDVWVESDHLEERFGIPLIDTRRNAPKWLRERIFELYGHRCFGCKRRRRALHIDHVRPRAASGDAAFRNLQPLCERCGQRKGSLLPEEVPVHSDVFFGPFPSDAYEGMFWDPNELLGSSIT